MVGMGAHEVNEDEPAIETTPDDEQTGAYRQLALTGVIPQISIHFDSVHNGFVQMVRWDRDVTSVEN